MDTIHSFDEVFDGQSLFRKILEAMANPGRYVSISLESEKMFGVDKAKLALAYTLLDNETSYCTLNNKQLSSDISMLTLSLEKKVQDADFIFVEDEEELAEAIANCKCGTLEDPQKSATIIVDITEKKDDFVTITGPGVKGDMKVKSCPMMINAIDLRDGQKYEYPQGIDFIFVTSAMDIVCIPRLVMRRK